VGPNLPTRSYRSNRIDASDMRGCVPTVSGAPCRKARVESGALTKPRRLRIAVSHIATIISAYGEEKSDKKESV